MISAILVTASRPSNASLYVKSFLKRSDKEGVMRSRNASATFDRRAAYTGSGRRAGGLRGTGGIGLLLLPCVARVVEFGDEGTDVGRFGPLIAVDERCRV